MLPKSLSALKREKERILQEGILCGCRIVAYRPGGTARGNHVYYQLRSREPFENGKRTRHLKTAEIGTYRQLIKNGKRLQQIERHMAYLESGKQSTRSVITSSASDEWYTPPEFIALAQRVMGHIDLDPASNVVAQTWIQAASWYGIKEDGLQQPWVGRVWLNPPYGTQMQQWITKAIDAYRERSIACCVVLARPAPGSAWYQAISAEFPCCIPHKRIRFIDRHGVQQKSPVHGNAFFYLGEDVEHFRDVFSAIGVVTRPF